MAEDIVPSIQIHITDSTSPSLESCDYDDSVSTVSHSHTLSPEIDSKRPKLRHTTSVTFAPLPTTEPRTRRYSLGIAARSKFLRQQRAASQAATDAGDGDNEEGVRSEWGGQRRVQYRRRLAREEAEEEDTLVVLARLVRGASRVLFRRGSVSRSEPDAAKIVDSMGGEKGAVVDMYRDDFATYGAAEQGEDGRVWEEEVGVEFRERMCKARAGSVSSVKS